MIEAESSLRGRLSFSERFATGTIAYLFDENYEFDAARLSSLEQWTLYPQSDHNPSTSHFVSDLLSMLLADIRSSRVESADLADINSIFGSHIILSMNQTAIDREVRCKISGLSHAEEWPEGIIRWTDGPNLEIELSECPTKSFVVEIDVARIFISCIGTSITADFGDNRVETVLFSGLDLLRYSFSPDGNSRCIKIALPNAQSPMSRNEGSDRRLLTLAISGFTISSAVVGPICYD